MTHLNVTLRVRDAFETFILNASLLALPLSLEGSTLHPLPAVHCNSTSNSSQANLSLLDDILGSSTSLYLLLRRGDTIHAIAFVPYRAPEDERETYLQYRHDLVNILGEEHFETSLICKESAEITDARSWVERQRHREEIAAMKRTNVCDRMIAQHSGHVEDLGHKKNKCRLCDRRMKNKITDEALAALRKLETECNMVQISLDTELNLALEVDTTSVQPYLVSSHLPVTHPTFTLYRHPNKRLYFIFHSPDCATVQQRMKHTMAIPGLVNIHAEDCGLHVDQKIEIHEPEDLTFEEGDANVGKFRSMYLRGEWKGTESQYNGLEKDIEFYNAIR